MYLVDSAIQLLNNWCQINHYPLDNTIIIGFSNIYSLDSKLTLKQGH